MMPVANYRPDIDLAAVFANGTPARTTFDPAKEIGAEGLYTFYGRVSESYVKKLQWPDAYDVYDEMRRRDPTLRSILNAIKLLARQAEWTAEAAGDTEADQLAAEFLQQCLEDMSHTIVDLLDDAFTFLPFGWSSFEICYKRRQGERGQYMSQYDDERVGWRKFAFRRQSSFSRWEFDEDGGLAGWWQMAAPSFQEVFLPIEKMLHLVAERDGNNPEGLSLFESAYEPWHYITNLQIIGGIGWQRSFVGLPVFEFEQNPTTTDRARVESIGKGLVVDQRQFVSTPPGIKFRLESAQNSSAGSLLDTIKFYRILMTQMVLADFIFLGATETGSWSLGSDKSELFIMAVNGYLDRIKTALNRYAVPRLFRYNAFAGLTGLPEVAISEVRKPNLVALGDFLQKIAPYIPLGDEDELWVRQQAGMPETVATTDQPGTTAPDTGQAGDQATTMKADQAGLVQLADGGRIEERGGIEETLIQLLARLLREQRARVEELAQSGRNAGDDETMWQTEAETMRSEVLPKFLAAVNELGDLAIADLLEEFGLQADWSLANAAAADWAREFVGEQITAITETTRANVRSTVGSWIESGGTLTDLRKSLEPTFGRKRAELIAATEVTEAYAQANEILWASTGVVQEWEWTTVTDERVCPVCGPLDGQRFPLGEGPRMPAHPGCRCFKRAVIEVPGG